MNINNIAIEIEGIDKVGKDSIHYYLEQLANYAYTINSRGILSQIVYNDKFNRNKNYYLYYKPLIILLDVNELDHKIRCKMNGEPVINSLKDREAFEIYAKYLESFGVKVLRFNTTEFTPFNIANEIVKYINNNFKAEDFICKKPIFLKPLKIYIKDDLKNEDIYYGDIKNE